MPESSSDVAPPADAPALDAAADAENDLPYRDEVKRKALHLLALVVPLGMALLGRSLALAVLLPAALLALSCDTLRAYSARFARQIRRVFGPLMRAEELAPARDKKGRRAVVINGATWVLVTAALLTLVFPLRVAVPVFTMFMIGDAAAALVGRRFGRLHWGANPRTVEGTAAFLLVGLGVMACFPAVGFWVGAAGVVVAAAAEALPRPFNDNVRVPMVSAGAVVLLEWLLGRSVTLFG